MEPEIIALLETAALGAFFFYLFRALSAKISGLEDVVNAQKQTIDVMDKRIEETEKIGGIYKNLINDLPEDLENYKTIISKTKDDVILELKAQKEETENKLRSAEQKIQNSGDPQDEINQHLLVLKNLLGVPKGKGEHQKREYDLKGVIEFGERKIEDSVSSIMKSPTLEGFLREIGFEVTVTEDNSIVKSIFSQDRKLPNGETLEFAMSSMSVDGGWLVLANDKAWMNQERLSSLKDEFSSIKTKPSD